MKRSMVIAAGLLAAACSSGSKWNASSNIPATACLLDLDCNAGSFCALNGCVSQCRSNADCPSGNTCSPRGRCLASGQTDAMAAPPTQTAGGLAIDHPALRLPPGADSGTFTLSVTGLTAGQVFHFRLEVSNDMISVDSTLRFGTLTANAQGNASIAVNVLVAQGRVAANQGSAEVHVFTDAGNVTVHVFATGNDGASGQYRGSVNFTSPVQMGLLPFAFEVWPVAGSATSVNVLLYPSDNVLFSMPLAVPGTWDASTGTLGFEYIGVIDPTQWHDGDVTAFRGSPNLRDDVDLAGVRIDPTLNWGVFDSNSLGNPFKRWVGRRMQVSVTGAADGSFQGRYAEELSGLTQAPLLIQGSIQVVRRQTVDELVDAGESAPVLPTNPLSAAELPVWPGPSVLTSVAESCAAAVDGGLSACATLTNASPPQALNDCAAAAVDAGATLASAYTSSTGGGAYQAGYGACTGVSMATPGLAPPNFANGCYSPDLVGCALAAFSSSASQSNLSELELEAYVQLFQLDGLSSTVYQFLSNEYASQSVEAIATSPTGSLDQQVQALSYAAQSAYLSSAVLMKPALLDLLASAPSALPAAETATGLSMQQALQGALTRRWDALRIQADQIDAALDIQARAQPLPLDQDSSAVLAQEDLIRQAVFATYVQGAFIAGALVGRYGPVAPLDELNVSGLRSSLGGLVHRYLAVHQRLDPLGFDPGFVPIASQQDPTDTRTVFQVYEDQANLDTATTSNLQQAFNEFTATSNSWQTQQQELEAQLNGQLDSLNSQITALCGSAAAPESPWVQNGVIVAPTPDQVTAYRQAVQAFPNLCLTSSDGQLAGALLDVGQAALDSQAAEQRVNDIGTLIQIEVQRVQRIEGINNQYLTYTLADQSQIDALDLTTYDQQIAAIKAKQQQSETQGIFQSVLGAVGLIGGIAGVAAGKNTGLLGASLQQIEGANTDFTYATSGADQDLSEVEAEEAATIQEQAIQQRETMEAVQKANDEDVANSQATVQQYLVKEAELVLELEEAGNRAAHAATALRSLAVQLHSLLVQRDTLIERTLANPNGPFSDPAFRITLSKDAAAYQQAFALAQQEVFFALRALEYETGWQTGLASTLFQAASPDELRALMGTLGSAYDCFTQRVGTRASYQTTLSVRKDIFGIHGPWADPVTGTTYSEGQQFRAVLLTPDTAASASVPQIQFSFATDLSVNAATGVSVSSPTRCTEEVDTLSAQVVGNNLGTAAVNLFIQQKGAGVLRSCSSAVGAGGADNTLTYDLAASGNSTGAAIQAGVSGLSPPNGQLRSRPVASSQWVITLPMNDPQNKSLDLEAIDDIQIVIGSTARPLPQGGVDLSSCL
jgi:hypothetical protein